MALCYVPHSTQRHLNRKESGVFLCPLSSSPLFHPTKYEWQIWCSKEERSEDQLVNQVCPYDAGRFHLPADHALEGSPQVREILHPTSSSTPLAPLTNHTFQGIGSMTKQEMASTPSQVSGFALLKQPKIEYHFPSNLCLLNGWSALTKFYLLSYSCSRIFL